MAMKKGKLGEILIQQQLIEKKQLQDALVDQERWGGKLGQHLIRMGAITENELLGALSFQYGIATIDFTKSTVKIEALETVPKKVCDRYNLVPVALKRIGSQKKLLVAIADPMNFDAIREVEFVSSAEVSTVLALESHIEKIVEYCYHPDGYRESNSDVLRGSLALDVDVEPTEDDSRSIVISQDGRELMLGMESRSQNQGLRALINLLIDRGVLTLEEFHAYLDAVKQSETP